MANDDYVDVEVMFFRATDKAILVANIHDTSIKVWVPRSTLHAATDTTVDDWLRGTEATITVREWLAREKELI